MLRCLVFKKKNRTENDQNQKHKDNLNNREDFGKHIEVVKKKPGRKSIKNESRQIREERKKNRNLGLIYATKTGKIIKERKCRELLNCRLRCKNRITEEKRQQVFKEYWAQRNFNKRIHFLARLITQEKEREKWITKNTKIDKSRINIFCR